MCVAGARPNFVKIKPILDALAERDVEVVFVHTGQHYDDEMSARFFDDLNLAKPDFDLGVGSGSHVEQTVRVMLALELIVKQVAPDVMIVVGDVNSTLGAALTAAKTRTLLAHVEAGLRSGDWSMPEEVNRVLTDRMSDVLFAPSQDAVDNLAAEGITGERVHLVGNVMIDSLMIHIERARALNFATRLGLDGDYGLVTLHRPENVDEQTAFVAIVGALGEIAARLPLIFPVHPRTRRLLAGMNVPTGIKSIDPVGYLEFLSLESGARVVITDSGGVQEETTVLGVPCLTVRETTERPITVTHGTNRLIGRDLNALVSTALTVMEEPIAPKELPLWDGHAAQRIVDVLVSR